MGFVKYFTQTRYKQDINRVTKLDYNNQFYHNGISLRHNGKALFDYEYWGLYLPYLMVEFGARGKW